LVLNLRGLLSLLSSTGASFYLVADGVSRLEDV
jgi:hypothetical protein